MGKITDKQIATLKTGRSGPVSGEYNAVMALHRKHLTNVDGTLNERGRALLAEVDATESAEAYRRKMNSYATIEDGW